MIINSDESGEHIFYAIVVLKERNPVLAGLLWPSGANDVLRENFLCLANVRRIRSNAMKIFSEGGFWQEISSLQTTPSFLKKNISIESSISEMIDVDLYPHVSEWSASLDFDNSEYSAENVVTQTTRRVGQSRFDQQVKKLRK